MSTNSTTLRDLNLHHEKGQSSGIWTSLLQEYPLENINAGRKAMAEALENGFDLVEAMGIQLRAEVSVGIGGRVRGLIEFMLDVCVNARESLHAAGFKFDAHKEENPGVRILLDGLNKLPPEALKASLCSIEAKDAIEALGALVGIVTVINEKSGGIQMIGRDSEGKKTTVKVKVSTRTSTQKASKKGGPPKLSYGQVVRN